MFPHIAEFCNYNRPCHSYRRRLLALRSVSTPSEENAPPKLTFQHWSGFSPYTSSCELSRDLCFW